MEQVKSEISKVMAELCGISVDEAYDLIEIPPGRDMGDLAFPCFRFAKTLRKSPNVIAAEISEKINTNSYGCGYGCVDGYGYVYIEEAKSLSAYVNFYIKREAFTQSVIKEAAEKGERFGESDYYAGKTAVIDFSSPNIAKPFHVGHLRTTIIGNAIRNVHKACGYETVAINYLGDWGTQFGKLGVAYEKWGNEETINNEGLQELNRLYIKFHDEAEQDPSLKSMARAFMLKMQNGDEEALRIWKWFFDISMVEYEKIYETLEISFDSWLGESFYNDKMDVVVEELTQKGLLVESDGAMIIDLEDRKMPPALILRSDGGTLYPTRDIAAAIYRHNTYHFDKAIYVTGSEQTLHFAQWFAVIDKMDKEFKDKLIHIPLGMYVFDDGKFSTRAGRVIWMKDLLAQAIEIIEKVIEEKNPKLENKKTVAEQIGIGAIKFNDLYNSRIKDIEFSWEKMLSFEGETGPYVQYAHARCASLLSKSGFSADALANIDAKTVSDDTSFEIIKLISRMPERIIEAANKCEPFLVSRLLIDISQSFNKFYHDFPILEAEESTKLARLAIVYTVKNVLKSGLSLLGIAAPDKM